MFYYFGSKARLAHTYQAPKHDLIVEPFAGAAGYSMYWLQRRPDLRCLLLDADPVVTEIWHRLLSMSPSDLWGYPLPEKGEITFDPIYLTGSVSSGSWGRYKRQGDFQVTERQARDFSFRRLEMAQTLSSVQGRVSIECRDYQLAPDVEATWFIDPPYQHDGSHYNTGNQLDWPFLADWCRSRRGQVIVCESENADWMDFTPHVTNQTGTNADSVEVVWYSDPELTLMDLMQ